MGKSIILYVNALSIFNCSIGIPDIDEANFIVSNKEAVTYWEECESVYERVAEKALHINTVPEQQIMFKKQVVQCSIEIQMTFYSLC